MFIRKLHDCPEFIAGDKTILREILHPDKMDFVGRYSLAHAVVKAGDTSQLHSLQTSEVYYILEGGWIMRIDEETATVWPGDTISIPPHAKQCITNTGTIDLKFLCIVDPAWRVDDEEVF